MGTSASKTDSQSQRNGSSLRRGAQFLARQASEYQNQRDSSNRAYSQNYAGGCSDAEDFAYQGAMEEYSGGYNRSYNGGNEDDDDYDGGCGCRAGIIGSDELDTTTVKDYSNSVNSKTKDKIIDEIIDVGLKLGLKITGTTQQDKIKSLLAEIPAGDRFKKNDEVHKKTCIGIANAINSIHGNIIISTELPPEIICQHVVEIISSLSAGMHTEFLAVYNDVRKVLKNLHVLKESLFEDHAQIIERIKNSDDATLPQQITTLNDLHKILTDEIDRQIQLLSNLLNVTLFPSEKNLASLIKNKKDVHGYIEKIDVKIGSDKFGHVISDVLKGLGLTANFALIIERALKTVGITLDEYSKSGNLGTLRTTITRKLLDKKLDENQLHEYLAAADLLYKNFYRHEDIAKKLEDKTGQHENYYGSDEQYSKTLIDKRVSDRKTLRNLIFTSFYKQLNSLFDQFVASLDQLTMKVGTEIPLSDQLDGFRQILQRVNGELIRNKNIYYALIGYYNDAMSKSKKDALLGDLRMVSSYIDTILEMDLYKPSARYFQTVQGHIKAMVEIIDTFSDEIAAKFGRGEDADPQCMYLEKLKDGGYDQLDSIAGGLDPMSELGAEPVIKFKSTKSIHDAIRQFDYMYRVAQIRYNLTTTGKELAHYSEKYEKIVANSIADILTHDKKIYLNLRRELDPERSGKPSEFVASGMKGFTNEKAVKDEHDAARKFLDSQWETKKKFWTTIEAVDTYMRVFTDAIVKNPNDIREIKSMIDEIDVIGDWYSDATGEDLTAIFEYFPSYMTGPSTTDAKQYDPPHVDGRSGEEYLDREGEIDYDRPRPYTPLDKEDSGLSPSYLPNKSMNDQEVTYPPESYRTRSDHTHYYARIAKELEKNKTGGQIARCYPGNPYLVTIPTFATDAKMRAKKMFTGLAVLKNLLSVFVNIGSKFGGEELRKKVFMTPAQMYNNLIDYLQASAFAQGWGVGEPGADLEMPPEFYDSRHLSVEINLADGTVNGKQHTKSYGSKRFLSGEVTYPTGDLVHLGVSASKTHTIFANRHKKRGGEGDDGEETGEFSSPVTNVARTVSSFYDMPRLSSEPSFEKSEKEYGEADEEDVIDRPYPGFESFYKHEHEYKRKNPDVDEKMESSMQSFLATKLNLFPMKNVDRALLFKKRWGVWMRSVIKGVQAQEGFGFKREDEYFVLALKSIAAKIFTVTGMYDVLDRPMEFNGLNPIRMIIGGAAEFPKVESEAVALYLRLPLLAKFYRGIFGWDDTDNYTDYSEIRKKDTNVKISMVPDIDGVFAGLIRLVFRKTKFVDNSAYGEEDVKEIIKEVNLIYQRMSSKYKQNVVMETIHEFVAEMNRRYGVVSQSDRNAYETEFGYRYDYSKDSSSQIHDRYSEAPDTEIAILPGEADDEIERPSATQRLLGETFDSSVKTHPFTITNQHKDLVYKFRCAIDKYFENPDEEYTFNNAIKSAQLKLKQETDDEKRFKIITSLVRGVDIYSKVDGMKYVLFHETVVGGLNVLSGIHSMLARFKLHAHIIDIRGIEDQIWEYFMSAGFKNMVGLVDHIKKYLIGLGITENSDRLNKKIEKLFGHGEAWTSNGGHVDSDKFDQYIIKGVDAVNFGVPGKFEYALRFPASNNFGVVHAPPGSSLHSGFHDKQGYLVTNTANKGLNADPLSAASGGLASIMSGYSIEQLRDAYRTAHNGGNQTKKSLVADTFMRFIFNKEYIMKELIENLFGLGNDLQGLVTVNIDDGKLHIGYGGLKTLIEDMFQHVNYFIDLLRPHIKPELIANYTDKMIPGSFYWLHEQLMEKIIIGRPKATTILPGESSMRIGYTSIDELMHKLSYSYEFLTRTWSVDGYRIPASSDIFNTNADVSNVKNSRTSYDKVFAQMIFYDAACPQSGIIRSSETLDSNIDKNQLNAGVHGGVKVVEYLHNSYESLHFSGPAGNKIIDTRYAARFTQLYTWKNEFTFNRSALFAFNQLIAKYIQSFYDTVSGKMYVGLINQFANGAFNRAIVDQTFTYPDTVPLLNFKFTAPSDAKVPPTQEITMQLSAANTEVLDMLIGLIKNYLTYGLNNTYFGNNLMLSKLLNPSTNLMKTLNVFYDREQTGTVSIIYIYFLAYGFAEIIATIFKALEEKKSKDGTVDVSSNNAIIDMLNFANPGENVTTHEDLKKLYVQTGVPKFKDIIYKILTPNRTPPELLRKLTLISDTSEGIINCSELLTKIADDKIMEKYKNKINSLTSLLADTITWPDAAVSTEFRPHGGVIIRAMKLFPFDRVAVGKTPDELHYQVKLFASLVFYISKAVTTAVNNMPKENERDEEEQPIDRIAAANDEIEYSITELQKTVNKTNSTYLPGTTGQPKYLVKYEEMLSANTDYITATGINRPFGDANYLTVARSDAIEGVYGPNSIKELGRGEIKHDHAADNIKTMLNFGNRADPDEDHVLFTSLSVILKNILQSRNVANQSLVYSQDNVADIALYMKEKMRANLPGFKTMFKELLNRCEFLKKMMSQSEVNMNRNYGYVGKHAGKPFYKLGIDDFNNPWPYVLKPPTTTSDSTKQRFTGILDSIIRGCTAFITSCDQVLREIGDDPKYFELYQNSIKDYKTQYGVDPLMPLSTTLAVLKNSTAESYMDFFPIHSLGEDQFKFMYGTRAILGQPGVQPLLDHNPGFVSMIEQFNLITDSKFQADKGRAESFHKTFVKLVRYIHELKHVKGFLTPHIHIGNTYTHPNLYKLDSDKYGELHIGGLFTRENLVVTPQRNGSTKDRKDESINNNTTHYGEGVVTITNKSDMSLICDGFNNTRNNRPYPLPVYSIAKTLNDSIKLTESSFKDEKIKELVMYLSNDSKKRNSLEIQNIIDLNIVPINVHALMREIPLANLYNYAYTFDRLIIELYYGLKNDNARKLISELCDPNDNGKLQRITSAKDMLVALLINPYMNLWEVEKEDPTFENYYEKYGKAMLLGVAQNGELGRPKFLSDQIYNKAVFGEVYSTPIDYNEMGPPGASVGSNMRYNDRLFHLTTALAVECMDGWFVSFTVDPRDTKNADAIKYLIKLVIDRPHVKVDDLRDLIETVFTKVGKDKFVTPPTPENTEPAALIYAFILKIAYWSASNIIKNVRKGVHGTTLDKELGYFQIARDLLKLLNRNAGQPFLGAASKVDGISDLAHRLSDGFLQKTKTLIDGKVFDLRKPVDGITDAIGPESDDTDRDSESREMGVDAESIGSSITGEYESSKYKDYDPYRRPRQVGSRARGAFNLDKFYFDAAHLTSFRQLASELSTNYAFPRKSPKNIITNFKSIDVAQIEHILRIDPKTEERSESHYLHWLDVVGDNDDYQPPPGATLQRKSRGDNYNVMDSNQIKSADVGELGPVLAIIGRLRFDTVLIRNLIFVVNLYRSVRMKLQRDLVYSRDIVQKSSSITNSQLTEFYGNQVDQGRQTYQDAYPQRWNRYRQ